ncbi:VOC family protein [Streptomyces sp. SID3343]|uniref:VOC family protein n=1 Tax=Streptomyces sp. SID3343 TaxID=2690260 RepID=UPI00136F17AA|nr:VOC family protein [Streptomyces sp. SID3343]MYV99991.1 VOC family protein [Streptomyces sp. SID3343]
MPVVFSELVFDANDVPALAEFWRQVLDWDATVQGDEIELSPPDQSMPTILFVPVPEGKAVKDRLHIDVSPALGSDQPTELARLLELGAKPVDIGQGDVTWHVLLDPEGNEFCLLRTPK